jgi:hypothetical protein
MGEGDAVEGPTFPLVVVLVFDLPDHLGLETDGAAICL